MAKLAGITSGVVTIGATDYEVTSCELSINKEELEYTPMTGDDVANPIQVGGGKVWAEGSVEFAWDNTLAGSGSYPAPFNPTTSGAMVINVGAKSVSFDACFTKIQIKKGDGICTVSGDFKSSGAITYA